MPNASSFSSTLYYCVHWQLLVSNSFLIHTRVSSTKYVECSQAPHVLISWYVRRNRLEIYVHPAYMRDKCTFPYSYLGNILFTFAANSHLLSCKLMICISYSPAPFILFTQNWCRQQIARSLSSFRLENSSSVHYLFCIQPFIFLCVNFYHTVFFSFLFGPYFPLF